MDYGNWLYHRVSSPVINYPIIQPLEIENSSTYWFVFSYFSIFVLYTMHKYEDFYLAIFCNFKYYFQLVKHPFALAMSFL